MPFFPSYPVMWKSFLQLWFYKNSSASFQLIFHENCSTCRCILMCLQGDMSSTSSYSTILIQLSKYLYNHYLNSLLGRLLISTFLSSSGVYLVPSFGPYSSVASFMILWFYFYVLGRLFTFPDLGEVALCSRHPMDPCSTLPSDHQSYRF